MTRWCASALVLVALFTSACATEPAPEPASTSAAHASGTPGPDDDVVFEALAATVAGDSLTPAQMEAVAELMELGHADLMRRALAHLDAGQPGRAEIELTLVQAGADTSPARSYEHLSLLAYSQIVQDKRQHATASLIYASGAFADLDTPSHPALPDEIALTLASAYVDMARGAPEDEREPLGRQAALWWARAGADGHLEQLAALGPDERLIAAWAYAQTGRVERATVHIAQARTAYRARIATDPADADAHEGLARSYEFEVTGVPASANADSAAVHRAAAERLGPPQTEDRR